MLTQNVYDNLFYYWNTVINVDSAVIGVGMEGIIVCWLGISCV